jgi:hypothetical protein
MKTVYRWVKVAEEVPRQEAVGRTPTELLVRTGQIDSPEVQQVKKYAEEAARKAHELDQDKQKEQGAEEDEDQEEVEEKEDEPDQADDKPKPKPRRRPRPPRKDGADPGGNNDHPDGDDPTDHPPSPNSNDKEAEQLAKLRQAKALIESIHFPTTSVRKAARELADQIGSSLLGSKKPIPTGKWPVRVLGYMDPDKAAGAKALADSVVGGTVSTVFRIGLRPVQIIDLEIDESANGKLASTRQGNGTAKTSGVANNNIEVEFTDEEEHTTWLEILDTAYNDAPTYPLKVKLPCTSKQKQALREQLENDPAAYEPDTLDNL